jgi:diketogulonate reductase-like aldo/keto reductase
VAFLIDSRKDLNDGHAIPRLGFGVWLISSGKNCEAALRVALEAGYRHIDTAAFYGNETSVGKAVRDSGLARQDIFVTTKLWNSDHGDPEQALQKSLDKLKLDYVDLYLIHYPVPQRLRSWRILEGLQARGKARSIGVSNFTIRHLTELIAGSEVVPAVNQVEFHPYLYQHDLLEFCRKKNIAIEAYSPLTHGKRLNDAKLVAIAKKYPRAATPAGGAGSRLMDKLSGRAQAKSTAQILIRWALQHEMVVIPKSANPQRIVEDAEVFDFAISAADMETLDGFNENLRTCWDPTHAP